MEKLTVVGWTSFESEYPTRQCTQEEMNEIIELLQEEIKKHKYYFGGEEHQYSATGVPVFSDGTCFRASMRGWGYLMSTIYVGPNNQKLSYMDFYMSLGDKAVLPKNEVINIKPGVVKEESLGLIVREDGELLSQTLSMGMPLMTFDKVLKKYMWVLNYHNFIIDTVNMPEYKIYAVANCDGRFKTMNVTIPNNNTIDNN